MTRRLDSLRSKGILKTAHGGASWEAPPNTREAVEAALLARPDWIELDLHRSRDGRVVLWHDGELYTPNGKHEIAALTWAELQALDLIDGTLITLDDALDIVGKQCGLMLDLKASGLAPAIRQALQGHDPARHIVCGNDLPTFDALRDLLPVSLTPPPEFYRDPAGFLAMHKPFDAVTVYWRLVDKSLVEAVHAAGALVLAWTVDYPAAVQHLQQLGVDGITTNNMSLLNTSSSD